MPTSNNPSVPGGGWRQGGAWFLGGLFVVTASLKLLDVHGFEGTIDALVVNALGGTRLPLGVVRESAAIGVIAAEAIVGVGLLAISRSPRLPAIGAAALLIAFSTALISMLVMENPPSCGCLGSWTVLQTDARTNAAFGLARNAGLIVLAIWLMGPFRIVPGYSGRSGRAPAGFTVIELLVVIAVIAVLLAILLPALAGSKRYAKEAESLSSLRQCYLAVAQYADVESGYLPYLGVLGQPGLGALPDYDWPLGTPSYFRGQSHWWPTALSAHGIDLSGLPLNERHPADDGRVGTYIWLTHAASARPEYWVGPDPPDSDYLYAGVRLDEAQFPASKGLFLDVALVEPMPDHWNVGMADGSASTRITRHPDAMIYDLVRPHGALEWRVLTTREGMRGRDY